MSLKEVIVNLPEEQIQFLQALAEKEHLSFTDVLRRSINAERFFIEQRDKNCKVLVEGRDKIIREIIRS